MLENIKTRIKIWTLKRRAKNLYFDIDAIYCKYSCGAHMTEQLRGRDLDILKCKFNRTLDELDPSTPKIGYNTPYFES